MITMPRKRWFCQAKRIWWRSAGDAPGSLLAVHAKALDGGQKVPKQYERGY